MAQRDLIVSFLSGVPNSVRSRFASEPLYLQSPIAQTPQAGYPGGRAGYRQWLSKYRGRDGTLIPGMWRAAGGKSTDTIGRICVIGFSNGCIGVDEVLRGSDSNRLDTVIATDGIHGGYVIKDNKKALYPPHYKRYLNHAALCISANDDDDPNAPVMVITHSVIRPPFPSTTETANLIWRMAYATAPEDVQEGDCDWDCPTRRHLGDIAANQKEVKIKSGGNGKLYTWNGMVDGWYDRRAANNLYVFGWADRRNDVLVTKDPTGNADHIFQARGVLPEMLREFVVDRWNADCGLVASTSTAGFGDPPAHGCVPGGGRVYGGAYGPKVDRFPNLPDAAPASGCPAPPDGYVIVGAPGDPCAVTVAPGGKLPPPTDGPPPEPPPEPPPSTGRLRDAAVFLGAAASGYAITDYLSKR